MNKYLLILNLTVKVIVELVFVIAILSTIGLFFFTVYFVYYTVNKAINEYYQLR